MVKKKFRSDLNDKEMQKMLNNSTKRFRLSFWDRFKSFLETFFAGILILLVFILLFTTLVTLIENPVSLAILCGTILLIIIWVNK